VGILVFSGNAQSPGAIRQPSAARQKSVIALVRFGSPGRCTARKCGKRSASGIGRQRKRILRDWEARIEGGYITVKEAFDRFIAARVANKKSEATMVKYRLLERDG
jgi:hypothetical protein